MSKSFESDIKAILSHRHDNGGDFWATPDERIYKGNPFSTIGSLGMLYELGVDSSHEAVQGGLHLILKAIREDGRIRVAPNARMYPCYTAEAARMLCRFGLADSEEIKPVIEYFLANSYETGGWRCSFSKFGKGPETKNANPGATLYVLDVLRFYPEYQHGNNLVDSAVEFLLNHWEIREPLGPCHWGIGSMFMQIEYPFIRYNLFYYTYLLSFFEKARKDSRFREVLSVLQSKLTDDGKVIVENPHRNHKKLEFCAKGEPSERATLRYNEILDNLDK